MTSMLQARDWSQVSRRALTPTEIVKRLADLPGWKLSGDGDEVAIGDTDFECAARADALLA